jgi:head-tail adaptor
VKGEQVTTWTEESRWSEWRASGTTERYGANKHYSEALGRFTFRSDSVTRAIDATYQIVSDGTTYEVLGALDPDKRKREVWVFVKTPERKIA